MIKEYAKAIVAGITSGLASVQASVDDGLNPSEWVAAAIAFLGALAIVWAVPNKEKDV